MNPGHIIEWLLALALTLVAAASAVAVVRLFWGAARDIRRMVEEEAPRPAVGDDTLEMLGGSPFPGPGRPQASGVSRHDETGVGEWTPAELAFLHGHRETPDE